MTAAPTELACSEVAVADGGPPCAATLVRRASEFVQGSLGWRHLDSLSAQCKRGGSHRYMLTCLS